MAILAVLDDLLFRSKIESAAGHLGLPVTVAASADALRQRLAERSWDRMLLDLDMAAVDPIASLALIRQAWPAVPVVGFCSHVNVDLQQRAKQAGCTWVCARSAFVRGLPAWLTGVGLPDPST